jgi:Fur family ferric uptake transcriptional regulator
MKTASVILHDKHLRMTRQRKIILRELKQVKTHPSADEIYVMVRRYLPRISLGTVYRNLETLAQLGEIKKIEIGGSLKRFDGNMSEHYHVHCMGCDRIDDVPESIHFDFNRKMAEITQFQISGHRLEFIGLCPDCAEKQAARMLDRISGKMNVEKTVSAF